MFVLCEFSRIRRCCCLYISKNCSLILFHSFAKKAEIILRPICELAARVKCFVAASRHAARISSDDAGRCNNNNFYNFCLAIKFYCLFSMLPFGADIVAHKYAVFQLALADTRTMVETHVIASHVYVAAWLPTMLPTSSLSRLMFCVNLMKYEQHPMLIAVSIHRLQL